MYVQVLCSLFSPLLYKKRTLFDFKIIRSTVVKYYYYELPMIFTQRYDNVDFFTQCFFFFVLL